MGRVQEQAEIDRLLASVRRGISGVLVLRGDAGVGKSALLADAMEHAHGFTIIRFVAVESEMRLGFAALQALLTPLLDEVDSLPPPQQRALHAAFALNEDGAPDPFVVGLAALTLLCGAADRLKLLIIVDDAQWLDEESASVLAFVARRLHADQVGMLIALRGSSEVATPFDDLPVLEVRPLSEEAARELLDGKTSAPLGDSVADRIVAEAGGNPLALVELARDLSSNQLAGVAVLPEPLRIDHRLEARFLRQVHDLPEDSQRLLVAVAAEPTGDIPLILRAGEELEFDRGSFDAAITAQLVTIGPTVEFRHPLIRSAVYQAASAIERRRVHTALATATDADRDPTRRAWHMGFATVVPDEDVAEELERVAAQVQRNGSHTTTSALFERAAQLSPDRRARGARYLAAAAAGLAAGNCSEAHANASRAIDDLDDAVLVAQAHRVQAAGLFLDATPGAGDGQATASRHEAIMSKMLEVARTLAPMDIRLARATVLDTLPMGVYFGNLVTTSLQAVAEVARSLELPPDHSPTSADILLDALATVYLEGFGPAVEGLRQCLDSVRADPDLYQQPRLVTLGCWVALALGDDAAARDLALELQAVCRENGGFQVLPEALHYTGQCELRIGSLTAADGYFTEAYEIQSLFRRTMVAETARLTVAAWRGRESEVRSNAVALTAQARELGIGMLQGWIDHAFTTLELGLGNYAAAALHVSGETTYEHAYDIALGPLRIADEVEAHARGGDRHTATARLAVLSERAVANESHLDLGLLARCRALLANDDEAEPHFQESLLHLSSSGAARHLARTQLVYGEWLRRQNRRRDARPQLEAALDTFESAGADAFAERTRTELSATGAHARRRIEATRNDLTPQETQIARLAADGATNSEIAGRMFISPSTVDYHLRKVFRKLGVSSRRQLVEVLSE